jgi:16S rRNA (cytosine967-C5)-methyltransferase
MNARRTASAREAALTVLVRLEQEELFADRALQEALAGSRLDRRDRALVTELVNGVLRWRRRLDWHLDHLLTRRRIGELTPRIGNILRLGLYQLKHLERIPPSAATDESVKLARRYGHRGTASLVNAVLRSALRADLEEPPLPSEEKNAVLAIGLRTSHPDWMVRRWLDRYGTEETIRLCEANNRIPEVTVRVNRLRAGLDQVRRSLEKENIGSRPGRVVPGFLRLRSPGLITALQAYREGWIQAQDESAGLPVMLLDPRPGERIVDLCAAPGGKTSHLAERMDDRGLILAVDRHPGRLGQLADNCRRLDLRSVRPVMADGREVSVRPVDRLLLDAPCSGLGVLSRRADLRWKKGADDIPRLARLQMELLRHAADLVKDGGCLVYSTCTIEDRENEINVRQLLSERDDLVLEKPPAGLPEETVTREGMIRTFPHRHGVDGSFAACLRKIGG